MRKKLPFFVLAVFLAVFAVCGEDVLHTLQWGETLFALSRRYGVPADAIMEANNIANPDRLSAGQEIKIPLAKNGGGSNAPSGENAPRSAFSYTVERGDTLYALSRRFGVSVPALAAANGLERDAQLKIGDSLVIPVGMSPAESAVAASIAEAKPAAQPGAGAAAIARPSPAPSTASPAPAPAARQETPPAMEDPRTYEKKKIDANVIWPVDAEEVAYLTGKVYGVSITASQGANVKNIASGTVLSIGPYRGFGQVVFVQSGEGYIYVYGGLENIGVKSSDRLSFGDSLGTLGLDPLSGKSQLYFMVYKKDFPVDPATAPRG